MTKWEYLVVGPEITGALKGHNYGDYHPHHKIGFMMNDKRVLYKKRMGKERKVQIDEKNCKNWKRWNSHGQNQLLNHLGSEGWELIKSSGPYLFKRALK